MENQNRAGFWLSPQQERIWLLQQDDPGGPYRSQCTVALDGTLDVERLKRAIELTIGRYEILRTVYLRQSGMRIPFQVIVDSREFSWTPIDLTSEGTEQQNSQLEAAHQAERLRPFNWQEGPMVHAVFGKRSTNKHVLILTLPALCADGSALRILVQQIAAFYSGAKNSSDHPLRYVQFSEWQRELLRSEEDATQEGKNYWRKQELAAMPSPLLSLDTTNRDIGSFSPEALSVNVDTELASAIEQCARSKESITAFSLACWSTLLWRLSGQDSMTVPVLFDGREYEELRGTVGLLSKYLPLAFRFDGNLRFREILRQMQEAIRAAAEFQEYYAPPMNPRDSHADGVAFEYRETFEPADGLVRFSIINENNWLERFDLKLVVERDQRIRMALHYNGARLEREAVARIASHLTTLLRSAFESPELEAGHLPILSERERERVVEEWNRTGAEYPRQTIPEMFAGQAARTPERTAVVCREQRLSYAELNTRSNRLAHYLRRHGVGPDVPVGLCGKRSVELMVGLMAILKAGGAYVPLNPGTPKLRLEQQLAGAGVLLTQKKLLPQMPSWGGPILCLDNDEQRWAGESGENPVPLAKPEHLVYIIYTSGSTGVPKGVAVTHANLVNYSWFMQRRLELEKYPQGLQFATVSTLAADLGNTCIFPALISGGTLHLIPYEVATESGQMAGYNRKQRIDVLKIVPSHLAALLSAGEAMQVLPGKYLVLGGEALTPGLVDQIRAWGAGCEVLNHYGPTETTVGSLTLWLGREWQDDGQSVTVPIGRPIANTRVYVLDRHQQPVPVGVVGELYIGGAGVARGYLHRPEMTAERFLKDPFTQAAEARMYRTGDLVRYRTDGSLEFVGRGDDQVKVRGFRIELGEIEALLSECAGVRQVVVMARSSRGSDKRLVAYLTVAREQAPTPDQLRHYMKDRLPEYMIPAAFVLLDKLPLNANGKVDRQALPAPEQASAKTYVPPRTPTEQVVASIWAEVLRCGPVSIEDNFFDLGGHSLLATQVVSRLRERFSVDLALRILFEKPTVRDIAQNIEQARQNGNSSTVDVIRPARQRGQTTVSGN